MIELPEPVVIAAVPKKTFPGAWIKHLHIMAHDPNQPIRLRVELAPYDEATNTISNDNQIEIHVEDLVTQMQELPALAQAYGAVVAAVIALGKAQGKL
jgi:hypothetical protein